jgi:hypothetical protein
MGSTVAGEVVTTPVFNEEEEGKRSYIEIKVVDK